MNLNHQNQSELRYFFKSRSSWIRTRRWKKGWKRRFAEKELVGVFGSSLLKIRWKRTWIVIVGEEDSPEDDVGVTATKIRWKRTWIVVVGEEDSPEDDVGVTATKIRWKRTWIVVVGEEDSPEDDGVTVEWCWVREREREREVERERRLKREREI